MEDNFDDIPDNIRVCIVCLNLIEFKRNDRMFCSNKCNRKYIYDNKTPEEKKFFVDRECHWRNIRKLKKKLEQDEIDKIEYINSVELLNEKFFKKYGKKNL